MMSDSVMVITMKIKLRTGQGNPCLVGASQTDPSPDPDYDYDLMTRQFFNA